MANLATINNNILADSGIDPLSVVIGSGTANQISYWIDADTIGALTTVTYPSLTELSYVKGVTSAIQTQINAKQNTLTLTTTGTSGAATLVGATLNIPNYADVGFANPMTTLGDIIYGAAAGAATRLAGNITTGKQYLSQTGTGTVSAAPSWSTISGADITGAALTEVDDTNVTLTLSANASTALLRAVSITVGWSGTLAIGRGGTGLSALGTAGQLLKVNALGTALEYFTPTYISAAITSLNGLTAATQTFAVGTAGTDFAISSTTSTHTFNLPTASGTNRGALSSADWTTFNNKQNAITLTTTGTSGAATLVGATLNIPNYADVGFANPMTTLGDVIYGAAAGAATRLAGNITTAKQYLSQTGTGTVSAAPVWATIAGADITGAALTKVDDTNVTLTLGGTPATALLRAASLTLGWTGTLAVARGGTGASTAVAAFDNLSPLTTLGDTLFHNGTDNVRLAGNITTAKQFLSQTGTGTVSAAPAWATITGADITGAALTKTDDTNVTLTLGGTPATALLRAASITVGWTGTLAFGRGGTGLSTIGTAGQLLRVNAGATALEYFTPTYISAAITSLNGLTVATQTFATGTAGTDFAISSATSTHTFNLPTASATNRGALSSADWTTFNGKLTNPMTTLGDVIYGAAAGAATRLAGNITATKQFLSQTGTGTVSAAPSWSAVTKTDVGLSNVENTALSTWAGSANITTLGTISTGTWSATTIAVTRGGTGLSALGTANQLIRVNAGATALEYFTPTYISAAITSLNGLTVATQTFAVGTAGTDFAISSATSTHTFNLPTASGTNRGALSSADWTTFNNKQAALTLTTTNNSGSATLVGATLNIPTYTLAGLGGFANPMTTLGDVIYGGASGSATRLAGNITTAKQFLSQTGTGTVSAAPSWSAIAGADITGAALTEVDDTNVTLTLGGTPATALLRAVSITAGWTGTLAIGRGGTGLSALGTAGQLLRVNAGATALEYFTPTYLTAAITSLNGLTAATQTFATGATGTDFNISSTTSTHTFNIPNASTANRGLVTTGVQTFGGAKTFDSFTTFNNSLQGSGMYINATSTGVGTNTLSQVAVLGAANTYVRNYTYLTSTTLNIDYNYAAFTIGTSAITEGPSGTNVLVSQLVIKPISLTNSTGSTTNAATLYIEGAAGGTATIANNYAVWVDDGSVRLDTLGGTGSRMVVADGFGVLSTQTIPGAGTTAGSIFFSNGTGIAQDNANFFWDDANNTFYVGANPSFLITSTNILIKSKTTGKTGYYIYADDGTGSKFRVWDNGDVEANSYIKSGGTAAQILAADGSVITAGTNITISGGTISSSGGASGITSLNGLTAATQTFAVGTGGTDFAISSATSTHTFNLPTASATNRGALSSADWTTFNAKIGGTGTTNYIPKFTGASALGDSIAYAATSAILINTTTDDTINKLQVSGGVSATNLTLAAGTASISPLKLTSGTLETSPATGDVEVGNGYLFYTRAGRGLVSTVQWIANTLARTYTATTTSQNMFDVTSAGGNTFTASTNTTYYFEVQINLTGLSATNNAVGFGFALTGAVASNISYMAIAEKTNTIGTPTAPTMCRIATTATTAVTSSTNQTAAAIKISGIVRFTTGGSVTPVISQIGATAASVLGIGSYFKFEALGSNTDTKNPSNGWA